ncbi:MAG: holo-ACP synthase [Acidobacteriia bacterium]|nr:holo-ACP synthase [Terriglobia bacterium]
MEFGIWFLVITWTLAFGIWSLLPPEVVALLFGIGMDIIRTRRIAQNLVRVGGLKEELFTTREIAYCRSRGSSSHHLAARFAAKEAFFKAMGTGYRGGYRFDEIEIINDKLGKPRAIVYGKVKKFCRKNRITRIHVSLSHTQGLAKAVVLLERPKPA